MQVPCLWCNPVDEAVTWCTECLERMEQERLDKIHATRTWKWFAYGCMAGRKVVYWRAIFAPNQTSAKRYVDRMYRNEVHKLYPSHPDPWTHCVMAEQYK